MIDGECSNCVHYDKDSTEDPCYTCLGCYYGKPYFKEKPLEGKAPRIIDQYTQLPWGQYIYR